MSRPNRTRIKLPIDDFDIRRKEASIQSS
jgi:hypothetical protein